MPCRAPAVFRQCRVLRASPRATEKVRTANRGSPHGSRKKPNLGRYTYNAVPMPFCIVALRRLKAAWSEHGRGEALCVWELNTVALCYSNGKDTIEAFSKTARHGMCELAFTANIFVVVPSSERSSWYCSDWRCIFDDSVTDVSRTFVV